MARRRETGIILILLSWLLLVGWGWQILSRYDFTPAASSPPTSQWPDSQKLILASDQFTFVLFLHPECSCSRATLEELARLHAHLGDLVRYYVVFVRPSLQASVQTKLWKQAQSIPDVQLVEDALGDQARLFAARASGQSFLYAPHGELLFAGGITPSRGHTGDNLGAFAIRDLVFGRAPQVSRTPVFGCALFKERVAHATQ